MKNLSHISFERMTRRYQQMANDRLLGILHNLTDRTPSADEVQMLCQPPDEIDFVRTALANTLATSYVAMREHWKRRGLPDLRTAAYLMALESVGRAYTDAGVFP